MCTELCLFSEKLRFCPLFLLLVEPGLFAEEIAAAVEGSEGVLLVTEPTSAEFGGNAVWDCLTAEAGFDPSIRFLLRLKSDLICPSRSPGWNSDSSLWHDMHLMAALSDLICLSMAATCL